MVGDLKSFGFVFGGFITTDAENVYRLTDDEKSIILAKKIDAVLELYGETYVSYYLCDEKTDKFDFSSVELSHFYCVNGNDMGQIVEENLEPHIGKFCNMYVGVELVANSDSDDDGFDEE